MYKLWLACLASMIALSLFSAVAHIATGKTVGIPGAILATLLWSGILYGAVRKKRWSTFASLALFGLGAMITTIGIFVFVNKDAEGVLFAYALLAAAALLQFIGAVSAWIMLQRFSAG